MSCLNCGHQNEADARFCACCGAPQTGSVKDGFAIAKQRSLGRNRYVGALRRHWWLLALGLGIAALAAILSIYRVDVLSASVEKRDQVTYTAAARLLVTSAEAPYFRTTVPREVVAEGGVPTEGFASAPDLGTLISTANLYPILIESDEVSRLRQEQFGALAGSITTRAIYEVNSPGRFELSEVPVVEVFGHADTYAGAVQLTQATVEAFMVYVDETQDRAGLRGEERIVVEQLQRPVTAVESGGTSFSLPLMLFVVVAAASVALAILLDRLFPFGLRLRRRSPTVSEPAVGVSSGEANPEPEARRSQARL